MTAGATRFVIGLVVAAFVAGGCSPQGSPGPDASAAGVSSPSVVATPAATPTPTPSPTPEPTSASAIVPGSVDRSSLEVTATYRVTATIGVATGSLDVTTVIEARNDSGGGIDRLELNTIAARLGGIDATATVEDEPVGVEVDDQTLVVPLGGVLPDGATATVRVQYVATLRRGLGESDWMFSRSGGTLALYRWIPWVSRAVPFDRPNHGDPFVLPSSPRVEVEVLTDRPMLLAAPALEVQQVAAGEGRAWRFSMAEVRDVSIVLAPDFEVAEREVVGVRLRAFTRGYSAERLLDRAAAAVERQAALLGVPFPLPAFTVAETQGGFGLESPGLIWIPEATDATNLAYLIGHETAHQWFYGLVGNDQQGEPFADEAAADLLARTVLGTLRSSRCEDDDLDRAIVDYSQACYYEVVYVQGGRFLDDVRQAMGTDRFWAAMGTYLVANRNGLAGTRALLEALRAASPVDLLPLIEARFPGLY